jgi:hypothetical protein
VTVLYELAEPAVETNTANLTIRYKPGDLIIFGDADLKCTLMEYNSEASLQARRDALRAKIMAKPPINLQSLQSVIEAYMGLPVDIELADNYTVKVWYRGESRQADLNPLFVTIYDMIPANLIVEISYRWLIWNELDAQNLTFDQLDVLGLTMDELGRGDWIAE